MAIPRGQETQWRDFHSGQRSVWWKPGFDCRLQCEHEPKQNTSHGQAGDEIRLAIRSEIGGMEFASVLLVMTAVRRGELVHSLYGNRVTVGALTVFHGSMPTEFDRDGEPAERHTCEFLPGGVCFDTHIEAGLYTQEKLWQMEDEDLLLLLESLMRGPGSPVESASAIETVFGVGAWERLWKWHMEAIPGYVERAQWFQRKCSGMVDAGPAP